MNLYMRALKLTKISKIALCEYILLVEFTVTSGQFTSENHKNKNIKTLISPMLRYGNL